MKCPNCGGKGKYKNGFGKIGVCYYCHGTGKVNDKCERVKTNQEYIQTCNTEQLAEEIVKMTLLDKHKLYDLMESAEYEHGIGIGAKKVIVEWLKEIHREG